MFDFIDKYNVHIKLSERNMYVCNAVYYVCTHAIPQLRRYV